MNTDCTLRVESDVGPAAHERVLRQLRAAARRRQSDARRQWVRAATRC